MEKAVFQYIEHVIREYPEVERILLEEENEMQEFSFSLERSGVRGQVGNPTESQVMRLLTSKTRHRMLANQKAVHWVIHELPEDKRQFVELYYWNRPKTLTNEGIAQRLHIGITTLYQWKKAIVTLVGLELGLCRL